MKKLAMIIGVLLLAGVVAVPVMAFGPGWGWRGHHMMGYWGDGPGYGTNYGNLTPEERSGLDTLERRFYDETGDLRNQILAKSNELDTLLNSPNPDLAKARALQKEIGELRASLDRKTLDYEIEARKIAPPDGRYASRGWYGPHMGYNGYGPGGYCY